MKTIRSIYMVGALCLFLFSSSAKGLEKCQDPLNFNETVISKDQKANKKVVLRFEDEFKNKANLDIVFELMSEDFTHHSTIPGIPPGREGLKAIGQFVFSMISNIKVKVEFVIADDNIVATRVSATGVNIKTGEKLQWTENHFYRLKKGKIVEWWGEGRPSLN